MLDSLAGILAGVFAGAVSLGILSLLALAAMGCAALFLLHAGGAV